MKKRPIFTFMKKCNIYIGEIIARVMAEKKKSVRRKWQEDWKLGHKV